MLNHVTKSVIYYHDKEKWGFQIIDLNLMGTHTDFKIIYDSQDPGLTPGNFYDTCQKAEREADQAYKSYMNNLIASEYFKKKEDEDNPNFVEVIFTRDANWLKARIIHKHDIVGKNEYGSPVMPRLVLGSVFRSRQEFKVDDKLEYKGSMHKVNFVRWNQEGGYLFQTDIIK